jgi:hypothetical protein
MNSTILLLPNCECGLEDSSKESGGPLQSRLSNADNRCALDGLIRGRPGMQAHDTQQALCNLLCTRKLVAPELNRLVRGYHSDTPIQEYGVWFYYPCSRRLVHLLDKPRSAPETNLEVQ